MEAILPLFTRLEVRFKFVAFLTHFFTQKSRIKRVWWEEQRKNWKFSALHLLCVLSFKVTHSLLYRHTHCETKKGDNLSQCIKINHFRIWLISLFGQKIRWAKQKKWNPIYHCHWWHAWFCLTSSGTLDESQCFKVIFFLNEKCFVFEDSKWFVYQLLSAKRRTWLL